MSIRMATLKNGQIVLDGPAPWPEGSRLKVADVSEGRSPGMSEEDWLDTPEAIAAWLDWYDALEPLEFTPEEETDIAAWRQKTKEYTIANMNKGVEGLFE